MAAQRSVLFSYYLTVKLSRTVVNFDIDKNFLKINQSIGHTYTQLEKIIKVKVTLFQLNSSFCVICSLCIFGNSQVS